MRRAPHATPVRDSAPADLAASGHVSVLLHEAVEALLAPGADGIYVDGTFGRGGHTRAILARLGANGRLLALDRDPEAIAAANADSALMADPRFAVEHTPFSALADVLAARGIGRVDGVLLDLGVSSPQLDTAGRGFSFRFDGPLDMRMDTTRGESVADYLARAEERELADVIATLGEERFAARVARALVARREGGRPITTTADMAEVVAGAVRTREPGQHPATRTFQALRIFVNAELAELEQALEAAVQAMRPGARLVVISFHSLEDRIVKTFIARESRTEVDRRVPFAPERAHRLRAVARIKPSAAETAANPRARSAILRVAERTAERTVEGAPEAAER